MKQVTGSNPPQANNKVSIQQTLDGHSFSVPALSEIPANGMPVEVELLLPRTMLVPEDVFDAQHAAQLLAANGMPPAANESTVASTPHDGVVALTAIDSEALRLVNEKLGTRARFTTPLLGTPPDTTKTVWICRRGGILYIKVYDGGVLQLAEAVATAEETDTAYFVERLAGCFPLAEYELRIAGDDPEAVRRLSGKRFKRAVCE